MRYGGKKRRELVVTVDANDSRLRRRE
jgi:hypothetical protein